MSEKQRYAFNHDAETLQGGLGIPEPRMDELIKLAKAAYFMEDDAVHSFEALLNNAQPTNMVEAAAAGYSLGIIRAQTQGAGKNPLLEMLRKMGG